MPRDPGRIDEIISELAAYWHRYPDLRLCQIISNAAPRTNRDWSGVGREPFDPFYVEDDDILEGIRNLP